VNDNTISGYFREIYIETDCETTPEVTIQFKNQSDIKLNFTKIETGKYKLQSQDLSFIQKFKAFFVYSRILLLKAFISLLLAIMIAFRLRKIKTFLKNVFGSFRQKLSYFKSVIAQNLVKIVLSFLVSGIVYPVLLFLLKIDISVLYNLDHISAFALSYPFFFIPVCGIFLHRYLKNIWSFSAFWIIFFIMFFIIAPHAFAGNFGFYGFFHNYILEAKYNDFFSNLILPDIGYLAVLPRSVYGLSAIVNPSMTQVIAITSIITLLIYSWVLSQFLSKKIKFLWLDERLAFVFVIIVAVFPVFSLVPGLEFPLSVTDVTYYGILYVLILLFSADQLSKRNLLFAVLPAFVFVLSKAHMIVLLPVISTALFFAILKRRKNQIIYSSVVMVGLIIQAAYCYLSYRSLNNMSNAAQVSFAVGEMSLLKQIAFSFIYYIKSYAYIFFPYFEIHGKYSLVLCLLTIPLIVLFFLIAITNVKKKSNIQISLWFIVGNAVAYLSALFYAITLNSAQCPTFSSFYGFINELDLNFMRYTIGVHTVLLFSTVPLFVLLLNKVFSVYFNKPKIFVCFIMILMTGGGFITHGAFVSYTEFWPLIRGDNWSKEWSKLVTEIDKRDFYIPVVFYPEYKQYVKSENMEVLEEILPENDEYISFPEPLSVSTIVLLILENDNMEHVANKIKLYCHYGKIHEFQSLYEHEKSFRFVIFDCDEDILTDSIVFYNDKNEVVTLSTHIRIIGKQN